MHMKTLLATLAVVAGLAPGLALANGCNHDRSAQISCAEGQTWDVQTSSCITVGS